MFTVRRGQTVQTFDRYALSLPTRRLSRPFPTKYGWHLVQPLGPVAPARVRPFAEVRERVVASLLARRRLAACMRFVEELERELAPETAYARGFGPPG